MKHIVWVALATALAGCSTPIPPAVMAPLPQLNAHYFVGNNELLGAVKLGDVRVAADINGNIVRLSSSEPELAAHGLAMTRENYLQALQTALTGAKMLATERGKEKYILDANLISIKRAPGLKFFDSSVTMNCTAHYQLRRVADNRIVSQETLILSHRSDRSDLSGYYTLFAMHSAIVKSAVTGSIRENLTQLIAVLSAKSEAELTGKGV